MASGKKNNKNNMKKRPQQMQGRPDQPRGNRPPQNGRGTAGPNGQVGPEGQRMNNRPVGPNGKNGQIPQGAQRSQNGQMPQNSMAQGRPAQGRPAGKPAGRPQGKPQGQPQGKRQEKPLSKKDAKKHAKPERPERPENKPEDVQKKADVTDITRQIDEKEKKQTNQKKKTLNSRMKAERIAVRNGLFGAVAAAAGLLVLAFVVYHLVSYVAEKPKFSFVTDGSIEHTIGAKALIVREETPVLSSADGELVTSVTEGSRVATSQSLAMVVPEDKQTTVADLRNVQSQISEVQQELIEEGNVEAAKKVYDSYNQNLEPIIDSIRYDASTGKLQGLATYTSSISVLLDERETALSEIDFNDERLNVLRNDEQMYESSLQRSSAIIKAPRPGIVSFRLDGQEETLTFDEITSAERSDVRKLINSSVGAISANYNAKAQQNVCRIVQNERQMFAVFLSAKDAAATDFAVGTKHDINISSEGLVVERAEVVRCDSDSSGMLIIFSTTRYVEDLLDLRTVDIEIVITKSTGMRIQQSSIVNEDLIDSDRSGFSVYFAPETQVIPENFTVGNIFNINIIPAVEIDEEGNVTQPDTVTIAGCEVVHCEATEDGGVIVGFATYNEYSTILKINSKYSDGYQAVFIDSTTGLGANVESITPSNYKGIASIYINNQGFVAEHRVIVTDYDREFVIVVPVGGAKVPDNDTVIIVNPTSCNPNDKVV